MELYHEKYNELKNITIDEINDMGKQLEQFLKCYKRDILMTEEEKQSLDKLEIISNHIKYRRFDMLVMDPTLIEVDKN